MRILVFLLIALVSAPVYAVQPDEILSDPALETRARALSKELRCVKCQNQSIDDSDAGIARDMRVVLRERLVAGDTDSEAKQYLVDRYGEYVLLKPRFSARNAIPWLMPLLILIGGFFVIRGMIRRPDAPEPAPPNALDETEKAALEKLLTDPQGSTKD